jgi:FlaA1/EpsC-like NDP-sugar epimerase
VALRFDFDWSEFGAPTHNNSKLFLIDLLLTPVIFYACGLYEGYWKYAGLNDLARLMKAVLYRTIALIVVFYAVGLVGLSRAVLIIDTVLLLIIAGVIRLAPRFRFEFFAERGRAMGRRTLIVGAGDTGESLLRELHKIHHVEHRVVGFIDDDPDKLGLRIHGVPVLGNTRQMERVIEDCSIREVIIAIPEASVDTKQAVFEVCRQTGVRFKTVPTRGEMQRGAARISQIRVVDLEDLLGREVVDLDQLVLRQSLSGRRVLVTGAAGSIGREMARQIASYQPAELILVDRNENNLFYLEAEIGASYPLLNLRAAVADVLDRGRLQELFREERPEVVFHAAAYKHVPLMEQNAAEAIKNNVLGTLYLAEVADAHHVERFIYISTDKAVRPTSVMGATKRLGERLVQSVQGRATRFMAVRFGNVLGSDGSVIPTFRRQIAAGGPVTVTHPEASRYFMTIPEAVHLVLTAGAMGEGGETFLLQMGEPVRIVDLARNMIELSGLRVDEDIAIVFTGLRPGEKLHEELQSDLEQALPTSNQKIMVLSGTAPLTDEEWRLLRQLEACMTEGRRAEVLGLLRPLVPEYHPAAADPGQPQVSAAQTNVVRFGARMRQDVQA